METTADGRDLQYWERHFGMGIAMSVLAGLIVLARTYVNSDEPTQTASAALAIVVLASVPVLLVLQRRIMAMRHLRAFFYTWDFLGVAAVTAWATLDGGGSSPYSAFYYVLVGHAALAFPPRATVYLGLSVVLTRLALGLQDAREPLVDTVLSVLVLALLATVSTFMARGQQALVGRARTLTQQAVRLADVDGLTGCLNHRAFHARLVEEVADATPTHPLCVLVLDVDRFKSINDGYGHLAGDEVLCRLGELLRASFRTQDVVGRIGGDEFAVLLPGANQSVANELELRLLDDLTAGALPHGATVTIGSAWTGVAIDAKRLLESADIHLYAKRRRDRGPQFSRQTTALTDGTDSGLA